MVIKEFMGKDNDKSMHDFLVWKEFTKDIAPLFDKNPPQEPLMDESGADDFGMLLDGGEPKVETPKNIDAIDRHKVSPNNNKVLNAPRSTEIDRRTKDKIKKGRMSIDGTLDLHGLSQVQAFSALQNAVMHGVAGQKRCLLVITGKGKTGLKSEDWSSEDWTCGQEGVLKRRTPQWLDTPPLAQHVLYYCDAKPMHGGTGALYVYLRRNRG